MRSLLPALVFVLSLTACASVRPAEESADMMLNSTLSEEQFEKMATTGFNLPGIELPEALKTDMVAFMRKHLDLEALRSEVRSFYLANFSAEELQVMSDYQASPTGQKATELAPQIGMMSARAFQTIMVEHRQEFMEMVQKHAGSIRPPSSPN